MGIVSHKFMGRLNYLSRHADMLPGEVPSPIRTSLEDNEVFHFLVLVYKRKKGAYMRDFLNWCRKYNNSERCSVDKLQNMREEFDNYLDREQAEAAEVLYETRLMAA